MNLTEFYRLALQLAPFAQLLFTRDGMVLEANAGVPVEIFASLPQGDSQYRFLAAQHPLVKQWPLYKVGKPHKIKIEYTGSNHSVQMLEGTVLLLTSDENSPAIFYEQDNSELRATYRSLRSTMEMFRAMFDLAPDVIALTRVRDNVVIQVNKAYARLSGHDPNHIIGRTSVETGAWVNPEDRARFLNLLMEHGLVKNFQASMLNKAGEHVFVAISGIVVQINDEPHLLAIFRDISAEKKTELELRDLNHQLETRVLDRTNELSRVNNELESFVFSISHDLRSPIRAITGFSSLLREQSENQLDADNKQLLARIELAAVRMMHMTDDLLKLSRLSRTSIDAKTLDLCTISNEIVRDLSHNHSERVVNFDCAPPLIAYGDPRLLRHVMENLLGNAFKYTAPKAIARIHLWSEPSEHHQTRFIVQDNGVGFDESYADRLFQPFSRMHKESEFPGTGVGLATVARIVAAHGGRVGASGKVGEGATFWFSLPNAATESAVPK